MRQKKSIQLSDLFDLVEPGVEVCLSMVDVRQPPPGAGYKLVLIYTRQINS
jgi:hypothetical protein